MQRSPVKDVEIKALLKQALTDKIDDRALFMKGIGRELFSMKATVNFRDGGAVSMGFIEKLLDGVEVEVEATCK